MIRVQNLGYSYWPGTARESRVLDDVSLELGAGEWGMLIGPSGGGKTTLAFLLAGFLHPFRGSVEVNGIRLTPRSARSIREKLSLVLQFPENQLFAPTVLDEVVYGLKSVRLPRAEIEKTALRSISDAGLDSDPGASPFHLSLGQKRKLALAVAMARNPAILILDEPTSGLDPKSRRSLLERLDELKRGGVTILQITHHPAEALPHADRIFFLSGGAMKFQCLAADFAAADFGNTEEISRYLPPPLIELRELKKRFPSLAFKDYSISGISAALDALEAGGA